MNELQKRMVILGLIITNFIFVALFVIWAMYRHGSIAISLPKFSMPSFSFPSVAPMPEGAIAPVATNNASPAQQVCYSLGPFTSSQKERADILLGDYQLKGQYSENIQASPDRYEFYWVLGNNQAQARALFDKQNESIFKGKGLSLRQDKDGQYVVSLAFLSSENAARQAAIQMATSAKAAGGAWKWRKQSSERSAFYSFKPLTTPNFEIVRAMQATFAGEVRLEQSACR